MYRITGTRLHSERGRIVGKAATVAAIIANEGREEDEEEGTSERGDPGIAELRKLAGRVLSSAR